MIRRPPRYRVTHDPETPNRCTLRQYGIPEGDCITYFYAPESGGTVCHTYYAMGEAGHATHERLQHGGRVLYWTPNMGPLAGMIRREARALYRGLDVCARAEWR